VSATLQDPLHEDRASVVVMKNAINLPFFGSLLIPDNDFLLKKRQKFNVYGKWEAFLQKYMSS